MVQKMCTEAVVMAQMVEQSPLSPEIRGSNPDIGKFDFLSTVLNLSRKYN